MKKLLVFLSVLFLPIAAHSQTLDRHHLLLDASLQHDRPYAFRDFKEASAHITDTCTLYIKPGVYWVDNPDSPAVAVGENGREPFGIIIRAKNLHFIGLGEAATDVVLASQRGQTQGAVGNFTMFDFWCDSLTVENLTMGNYCNVDLDYPLNPSLSRKKRNEAITQAHVGYVHGKQLTARKVRFISRLNLNPLNGAETSYYEDCHFECTDDAMNGTAVYRHCDIDLYGQKPFWSTFGRGAMFIDCDFFVKSDNREMYFCKQGGPLTLIDCRYHAPSDSIYIGWTAYPQPWLRCYQQNFTLNGKPYLIGSRQPQNTVTLLPTGGELQPHIISPPTGGELQLCNIPPPTGGVGGGLPRPPYLDISRHDAQLTTGKDTLILSSPAPHWRIQPGYESYVSILPVNGDTIAVIPHNTTNEIVDFCIEAYTDDQRVAACHLTVRPTILPPPTILRQPRILINNGIASLDYELDLQGHRDESLITWYRNGIPVSITHDTPLRTYHLTAADAGHRLSATIVPKSHRSPYGVAVSSMESRISTKKVPLRILETDFHDFPCDWQPLILEGFWTVDGYKPADTAEFPWDFDRSKPMWKYGEGFNGAVGKGLLQEQRGARLMYTPLPDNYGDMSLTLEVDPTKTAGQGFGSATGQYMDVCLKFDTRTLTGYGLRIIRTTKHAKAVDFLLVKYENGIVTPISDSVSSTCYRTGCTISLRTQGNRLTVHVETLTPQPSDSTLPHVVDLTAPMKPSIFGGIAIQHTGSCGESTTMLHRLQVDWE